MCPSTKGAETLTKEGFRSSDGLKATLLRNRGEHKQKILRFYLPDDHPVQGGTWASVSKKAVQVVLRKLAPRVKARSTKWVEIALGSG